MLYIGINCKMCCSDHLLFRVTYYWTLLLRYYFWVFRTFLRKRLTTNSRGQVFKSVSQEAVVAKPAADVQDKASKASCTILNAVASWLQGPDLPSEAQCTAEVWGGRGNRVVFFIDKIWYALYSKRLQEIGGSDCWLLLPHSCPFHVSFVLISWQSELFSARLVSWNWLIKQSNKRANVREGTEPPLLLVSSFCHLNSVFCTLRQCVFIWCSESPWKQHSSQVLTITSCL